MKTSAKGGAPIFSTNFRTAEFSHLKFNRWGPHEFGANFMKMFLNDRKVVMNYSNKNT